MVIFFLGAALLIKRLWITTICRLPPKCIFSNYIFNICDSFSMKYVSDDQMSTTLRCYFFQSSARVQFSVVIKLKLNATYSLPLIFPLPLPLFALPFTFPLLVPLFKFPLLFPFPLPLLSPPVIRMRWLCHKFFFQVFGDL